MSLTDFPPHRSGDLGCENDTLLGTSNLLTFISVSEAYMVGDVEVDNLKGAMNVCRFIPLFIHPGS